ncbi:MAG TPA: endolytic transglycosylase MltG [Polyangiaceae bacterium]|nr:endolytic transglycosylase MltG [Polyangiaceae bacterium]
MTAGSERPGSGKPGSSGGSNARPPRGGSSGEAARGGRSRRSRPPSSRSLAPPGPRPRRRWTKARRLFWGGALCLVVAALSCAGAILVWATREAPGARAPVTMSFTGTEDLAETGKRLGDRGLVTNAFLYSLYLEWFAGGLKVPKGAHLLETGLSPRELTQRIGRLPSRPRVKVAIPEGYTQLQIAERLQARGVCTAHEFLEAATDSALMAELTISGPSAEGYLFPATYELFVNSEAAFTVRLMVAETRRRLARLSERSGRGIERVASERNWTEREVLTLASIVEREAAVGEERPLIASVFYNRLDDSSFRPARMLQSDPTAAYGCGVARVPAQSCQAFTGKVTPELLRDASNPYNTYRHPGLPPGPIANPGEDAILAVLNPARTDYLYFVADGRGRHRFSRSFEDHRRAIESPTLNSTP